MVGGVQVKGDTMRRVVLAWGQMERGIASFSLGTYLTRLYIF